MDLVAGLQKDNAIWPLELQDPDCYKRRGEITDWKDPDQIISGDFGSFKELNINKQ